MTVIAILLKASILISFAALLHELTRRRMSAAARHLMWSLTAAGLLLLPVLSLVLPGWTAYTTTARTPLQQSIEDRIGVPENTEGQMTVNPTTGLPSEPAARSTMPWSRVFAIIYAAGVVFLLSRLALERIWIRRLMLNASEVNDAHWKDLLQQCSSRIGLGRNVNLLMSREETMPMAVGIRNGTIVIPSVADTWTEDRNRAVLLHELAHLSRHDCLTQMMAAVVCAFYWVHPGAWWIARRLRTERELACDDRVLSAGTEAREYASHLLELAYALRSGRPPVLAVSMAGSGQLEGRMLALLDTARNRAIPALEGPHHGSRNPVCGAGASFRGNDCNPPNHTNLVTARVTVHEKFDHRISAGSKHDRNMGHSADSSTARGSSASKGGQQFVFIVHRYGSQRRVPDRAIPER